MTYPEEQPIAPDFVVEVGAASKFLDLEPPATDGEQEDLQFYYGEYGADGVFTALHFFAQQRNTVSDPSYPTIVQAFSPDAIIFTDEELTTLPPISEEELEAMRAKQAAKIESGRQRSEIWDEEGIHNPGQASDKVEEVRRTQGDAAADEYYRKLWGDRHIPTQEEQEQQMLVGQRMAADRQRAWQALTPEEQLTRLAAHRVFLFRLNRGDFQEDDD